MGPNFAPAATFSHAKCPKLPILDEYCEYLSENSSDLGHYFLASCGVETLFQHPLDTMTVAGTNSTHFRLRVGSGVPRIR